MNINRLKSTLLVTVLALLATVPASAATHTPKDGPELVAAVKAAVPGDTIMLAPGVRYVVQELIVPVKPFGPAIVIRSSASLPDGRVTPASAPLLPIIASGHAGNPLTFGAGVANWRLDGIQIEATSMEPIYIQGADAISMDRLLLIPTQPVVKRAIRGNGTNITLTRSHIANVWISTLQDTQAFCAFDGAGPYRIVDNYLESSGENVMFGGANSASAASIPSDIVVEGNHMAKPLAWKGLARGVKNLFELKSARRVTIRNNLFENNWADAQNGYSILMTGRNDEGQSPWSVVEDVTFERNILRNVDNGINLLGYDTYQGSGRTQRITIRQNLIQTTGTAFQLGSELGAVTIDHNTVENGGTFMLLYKGSVWIAPATSTRLATFAVENLTVTNNIGRHNDYGLIGEDAGIGTKALTTLTKSWTWASNVLALTTDEERAWLYPAATYTPKIAALNLQLDAVTRLLVPGSEFATKGTDGGPLGWSGSGTVIPTPPDEICGNKKDDDGDGLTDEGCPVDPPDVPTDTEKPVIVSASVVRSGASSNYTATVKAEDNVAVSRIEYWLDGVWTDMMSAPSTEPNTYARKLRIVSPGAHVLKMVVRDAAGNSTTTEQPVKR